MWLSERQKRPAPSGESGTGVVTMEKDGLGVLLDGELRGLPVYGPAGYRWTPRLGQRVLVVKGREETPCVVGVRQDGEAPAQVTIRGEKLALEGEVTVNGEPLENYIRRVLGKEG